MNPTVTYPPQAEQNNAADKPKLTEQVKQGAKTALHKTQEKAGDAVHRATDQAKARINEQKDSAAESLQSVAEAVRDAGNQLREHDRGQLGGLAADIAQNVDNLSGYLRRTDVDEVAQQTEQFARRQPALFLGGALALGFLAGRFFASSGNRNSSMNGGQMAALPQVGSPDITGTTDVTGATSFSSSETFPSTSESSFSNPTYDTFDVVEEENNVNATRTDQ